MEIKITEQQLKDFFSLYVSRKSDIKPEDYTSLEEFKTDGKDYDFTKEGKEDAAKQLLKIFIAMDDDDQFIVTKDNDKLTINDNEKKSNLE